MSRSGRMVILSVAAMLAVACAERITSSLGASMLDAAFISSPLGFESTSSSFASSDGAPTVGIAFAPDSGRRHHGEHGRNGLLFGFDFMGGGFGRDFLGGPLGGGRPFDGDEHDALPPSCSYDAASGVVSCNVTRDGITIARTIAFRNSAGVAQSKPDTSTNSVTTHTEVSGTLSRRNGNTTTIAHKSDRSVVGLSSASTQRTVNGTSAGTETTTGSDTAGTFTAARVIGDTVSGLVIPVSSGRPSYPIAGSVIRAMQVTVTYSGKTPVSSSRREVITYDGSATATLVITHDGVTKSCTVALPRGRPVCG